MHRLIVAICRGRPGEILAEAAWLRDIVTTDEILLSDARRAFRASYRIMAHWGNGWYIQSCSTIFRFMVDALAPDFDADWGPSDAEEAISEVCALLVDAGMEMAPLSDDDLWICWRKGHRKEAARELLRRGAWGGCGQGLYLLDLADAGFPASMFRRPGTIRSVLDFVCSSWCPDMSQDILAPARVPVAALTYKKGEWAKHVRASAAIPPDLWLELMRVCRFGLPLPEALVVHENLRLAPFRYLLESLRPEWRGSTLWWFDGLRATWVGAVVRAGLRYRK